MGKVLKNGDPSLVAGDKSLDFFVCDIIDAKPKSDLGTMEHPVFSLSTKRKDLKAKIYQHNNVKISVIPSVLGCATILDKDILIYAIGQLTEGINRGRNVQRKVRITAYDYLKSTGRATGGREYERLIEGLKRLQGTTIHTNMPMGNKFINHGFGLIEEYRIISKALSNGKQVLESIEITLSEWLFNAVKSHKILTLSKDYFAIGRPLERRMYELARKHCGRQPEWKISLKLLHKKFGSESTLIKFRQNIKQMILRDTLPEYHLLYKKEQDMIIIFSRNINKIMTKGKVHHEQ